MLHKALLALVLPLFGAGVAVIQDAGQEPAQKVPGEDLPSPTLGQPAIEPARDVFGRTSATGVEALTENMQGAWTLVRIEDDLLPADGRSEIGFLVISDTFLSLEVHMTWVDFDGEPFEDAHQSGIHEIRYEGPTRIVTTSLIGSFLDEDEELEWEEPGFERAFEVDLIGDRLILTRDDRSYLEFRRRISRRPTIPNIYGVRPDGKDVFGNPIDPDEANPLRREDEER